MCSPSNISCHTTKTTGLNANSQNANSHRYRSEATNLAISREILPITRNTANSSPPLVTPSKVSTTDRNQEQVLKVMNNLVCSSTRAHSPQYVMNSEKKGILEEMAAPNAFLSKAHAPQLSYMNLLQNNSRHPSISTDNLFNDNKIMTPSEASNESNFTHLKRNQSIVNVPHNTSKDPKHELLSNPRLPPPLMLSSDEIQYRQYEHSLKNSPSPRDVTQDMHLYKRPGIGSPDSRSNPQGTYHHNHQMDFQPVPRVSLSQMWPQTSYLPRSPHCGETRQEPSPSSSASNSSIASPDDWSSNTDGNNMIRDQPHSSPSMSRSQHYMSPPMYRQQQIRPRLPFNLKPRPNNTYQTSQKQFQGQPPAQYSQFWGQQPGSYHPHSQVPSVSNSVTSPHHTRQSNTTQTPSPLSCNTSTNGTLSPPARTSPEILKTLLRKKACLYEPGTSRAITLLTWLVARRLALQHGYFSRQHLQSGVHAIVGDKISHGIITRTKVNRCMQVILNSCFYYIIPKPDGTEESGESFRRLFEKTVVDDTALIKTLPEPWNDLEISENTLIDRNCVSPILADMKEEDEDNGRGHANSKRQVLLCFNENVRCAEDVLRCHNDFIRDSAISANLALTPEEWRSFYLCKDEKSVSASPTKKVTTENNYDSYLSFDMPADVEESLAFKENISSTQCRVVGDTLGQMTTSELGKFRTTWCCKRYEHDATLCRFAHIDLNKGWLRRNTSKFKYSTTMCPKTSIVNDETSSLNGCYINACEDGIKCKFAHSAEEVDYHPKNYKTKVCEWTKKGLCHSCDMRDICPYLHPSNNSFCSLTPPRPTRHSARRMNDTPCRIKGHLIGGKHPNPSIGSTDVGSYTRAGAPMLYLCPAPNSEFDKTLHFPGLCSLYRRNCATYYAHDTGSKEVKYSNFGDNWAQPASLPSMGKSAGGGLFSLFGVV